MLPISKGGQKKKSHGIPKHMGPFIIFFTVLMPTCCVILEFFVFDLDLIKEDDPTRFVYTLQTYTLFFIYIMAMWSYYQAIMINNDTIPRQPPTTDNRDIDPVYKNSLSCLECNRWKPVRTHHCSNCGKCVAKMDHHCPWINNCVGLRNHRAFYLFTFYMTLGGIQYSWRSLCYFNKLYFSTNFFSESTWFYMFWTFTSVILYPTAAMLSFLFFYHSYLILTNQTTLEQMKSTSSQGCFPNRLEKPRHINVFDRGWIANVAWFFNYSWLWWMPFENVYDTDGTSYPIAPLCTLEDIKQIDPSVGDNLPQNFQYDLEQVSEKYQEYLQTALNKYKGKRIVVNDQVITIE